MVAHSATHQHKRHGKHQRQTKPFLKVYWPYIPMAVILSIALAFSILWQPRLQRGVLAYATSMSVNGLLQATNQKRVAYGVPSLRLNSKLDQAAQAKANDMAARNYWSHNTPEGNPPWIFIDHTGYKYKAAGENLAYGFITSSDTVAGWMNSPEHKANMLSKTFVDVGFGYANSPNYQSSGPETIVVAFYAAPLTTYSPPATSSTSSGTSAPQTKAAFKLSPAPAPAKKTPASKAESAQPTEVETAAPTSLAVTEPPSKSISRIAALSGGAVPWLASFISIATISALALFISRHALALHKFVRRGEKYVLQHVVFDVTMVSLIGLCTVVSQTAGMIR